MSAAIAAESIPATKPVSESPRPHIPRRHIKDAIRMLHGDGYTVSGAEAYHLIRRWQRWRRVDAATFIRDEFRAWYRRGDIIQMRSKPRASNGGWRVTS